MYKINFNHLYYFLTIAKEGSIVKASKKLHMTQPALSHQLKNLEEDLGKKLFDRIGRRLVLNKDGKFVKTYANKIFRQSEEMIQFLKSDIENYTKIIKVGVAPWISHSAVFNFLKPLFANQHIKLEVYEKEVEALLKDLQNNLIDIVLSDSHYSGRSQKLRETRIDTIPLICVCSSSVNPIEKFPKCLMNKNIITYTENSFIAAKIEEFFLAKKIKIKNVASFSNISLMKLAIEKSRAFGFLPEDMAIEGIKNKKLKKLGQLSQFKFSLWVITNKDNKDAGVLDSLLNTYKKLAK